MLQPPILPVAPPLHTLFVCLKHPASLLALTDSYSSLNTQFKWPLPWKAFFDTTI